MHGQSGQSRGRCEGGEEQRTVCIESVECAPHFIIIVEPVHTHTDPALSGQRLDHKARCEGVAKGCLR